MQPAEQMRLEVEPEDDGDELTVVSAAPVEAQQVEARAEGRAAGERPAAVVAALTLTFVVLVWRNTESPLWWMLSALATSAWSYALLSILGDTLQSVRDWAVEMITGARRGVGSWRDATKQFIGRWVWSRFRANNG